MLAAARASRRNRSRADSSPRYRSTDDFQSHGAAQIDVERLVCYTHRTAAQFHRFPVSARLQLVVVKWLRRLFGSRLGCLLERRRAGLRCARESPAKHADRAEFHRPGEFIATTRASALGIRAHGPSRPLSRVVSRKRRHPPPSGAKATNTAPGDLLSRCTSNCVFLYTSASNRVSEQNFYRWCRAGFSR